MVSHKSIYAPHETFCVYMVLVRHGTSLKSILARFFEGFHRPANFTAKKTRRSPAISRDEKQETPSRSQLSFAGGYVA